MVIFKKIKTMKNLGFIILGTVCLTLSSCKKEYTCTCTSNTDGNVISTSKGRMTKEKAKESCERSQNESQALVPVTCTLK
jgi:hypothetical protein